MKKPGDDVWLTDGLGYMVAKDPYQEHLHAATDISEA
jgi:hypothetical protein